MAIRRAGGMTADGFDVRRFAVAIKLGSHVLRHGRNVAKHNHFGGFFYRRVFDRALIQPAINVSAEAQLRPGDRFDTALKMDAPVVVTDPEEGMAGDRI